MEKQVKDRLSHLLKTIHMNEQELAVKIQKSATTVYRILKGETTPTRSTVQAIADATGSTYEWLMFAKGEMLAPAKSTASAVSEPWRDEAYKALKDEVSFLRGLVSQLTGKKSANFLKALEHAGVPSYLLNMSGTHSGARVAN